MKPLKGHLCEALRLFGEVAKKIPPDFKKKYPHIEWKAMAGMRDKLIHDYFGIDYEIVWDIVTNKIPTLRVKIKEILDKEPSI